jgi:hypothetical protein
MKKNVLFLLIILLLLSCKLDYAKAKFYNLYNFDHKTYKKYFELVQSKDKLSDYNEVITWANDIKTLFLDSGKSRELVQFFGELAEKEKRSDFKDLLNFIISDFIWELGNKEIAIFYMLKVDEKLYSIQYNFNPIGYYIAKRIINSNSSINIKKKMYELLLTNYKDIIDIPYTLYELSELYKKEFDIQEAVKVMRDTIKNSAGNIYISEKVSIYDIQSEINFFNYNKHWIYQDLETLIYNIKTAIEKRDKAALDTYRSRNGFFVELFQKESMINWSYRQLEIHNKWLSRINFSNKLETFSNNDEAYLRTTNWAFIEVRTWYFYFKRVKYPYDTRINNGWEWAGIYLGNPL